MAFLVHQTPCEGVSQFFTVQWDKVKENQPRVACSQPERKEIFTRKFCFSILSFFLVDYLLSQCQKSTLKDWCLFNTGCLWQSWDSSAICPWNECKFGLEPGRELLANKYHWLAALGKCRDSIRRGSMVISNRQEKDKCLVCFFTLHVHTR